MSWNIRPEGRYGLISSGLPGLTPSEKFGGIKCDVLPDVFAERVEMSQLAAQIFKDACRSPLLRFMAAGRNFPSQESAVEAARKKNAGPFGPALVEI